MRTTKRRPVAHYVSGGMEAIDVMQAFMSPDEFRGHLWGCAMKYLLRWEFKGSPVDDLQKAKTYIEWLIELFQDPTEGKKNVQDS